MDRDGLVDPDGAASQHFHGADGRGHGHRSEDNDQDSWANNSQSASISDDRTHSRPQNVNPRSARGIDRQGLSPYSTARVEDWQHQSHSLYHLPSTTATAHLTNSVNQAQRIHSNVEDAVILGPSSPSFSLGYANFMAHTEPLSFAASSAAESSGPITSALVRGIGAGFSNAQLLNSGRSHDRNVTPHILQSGSAVQVTTGPAPDLRYCPYTTCTRGPRYPKDILRHMCTRTHLHVELPCLICYEPIVANVDNVRRHYESQHPSARAEALARVADLRRDLRQIIYNRIFVLNAIGIVTPPEVMSYLNHYQW